MSRKRYSELDDADAAIREWVSWTDTHLQRSRLGFPTNTCREWQERQLGAIIPDVMMPRRVQRVDNAIRDMPEPFQVVIYCNYCNGKRKRLETYKEMTGNKTREFYRNLDLALAWVAARVAERNLA